LRRWGTVAEDHRQRTYRVNGHNFQLTTEFDSGDKVVQCTECLLKQYIDSDDNPEDYLGLMAPECHIEWLREPDDGFHGVALRNASGFKGRQLIGVDSDLEVVDKVRVYDDDAPLLASLLQKDKWEDLNR
jgi:hypothetical protein